MVCPGRHLASLRHCDLAQKISFNTTQQLTSDDRFQEENTQIKKAVHGLFLLFLYSHIALNIDNEVP